uniref:Uncharacterized protein n=1 Tax=Amphimedon queenslandica TaxID=400682 RepID=A0A1X7TNV6_AMPQE
LMSQNVIVESRPKPDPMLVIPFDKTMSMRLLSPDLITIITVQFLNGQSYKYSIDPRATIYALKWTVFK